MQLSEQVLDIRTNWAISDAKRDEGLTTPDDIKRFDDISYGPYGDANLMDIYVNQSATSLQPTIFNIHGGGWVYGSKEIYQFYCMSLAQRGFTVVNINYRLAPENRFPAALVDINGALNYVAEHGEEYFIDKDRMVLIGDSAGAQLASHYSTIFTNPDLNKLFGFDLPDITIKALGLNCGSYDGRNMILDGIETLFLEYIDAIDKEATEETMEKLDTLKYLTDKFPPAFIMSAQNDFLLPKAEPMYKFLKSKGVPCEMKIYGRKEQEEIAHVFHVNIRLHEATECNDDECDFFRKYV